MRFGTLGSQGSNHALVLNRYLVFRGVKNASITLYADFPSCFESLVSAELDFVLQVSVHPQHAECVAQYMGSAFIVDVFIAHSHPLALLTRSDVNKPRTLGLQPATERYTDLSRWPQLVYMNSITEVAQSLLHGDCDSGITSLDLLQQHPGRFRLEHDIGSVQDAWVLFGRQPLGCAELIAWPQAPVTSMLGTT